jgi:hypothetical protein
VPQVVDPQRRAPYPGAHVQVVQRVLGHATASMTVDLYGHLMDRSLWDTAARVSETFGGCSGAEPANDATADQGAVEVDGL